MRRKKPMRRKKSIRRQKSMRRQKINKETKSKGKKTSRKSIVQIDGSKKTG